jgi:NADPH:quinone reductase-like Zn-dependent oxidoreductase
MNKSYMSAVLLTGFGGPDQLEYREDVSIPKIEPDEILIRVGACGVNNTDIWTREGAYGSQDDPHAVSAWRREPMQFPRIQGADIVGQIEAVGSNVSPSRIGERVIVDPVLYTGDDDGLLEMDFMGSERDGGFAEFTIVPAQNAHPINSPLSDAELATFPTAYLTGEHMLNRVRLKQGETILITGASGGVGSGLVQLARMRGAQVVAIVGSGKEERVRQIGADIVVTRHTEHFYQAVTEAVAEQPLDVVADVVGGSIFSDLLRLLRKQGRYVTAGAIAGPTVPLDLRTVYLKHLEIIGSTLGTHQEFADLVGYIEAGKLKPLLARTYPLKNIGQAQSDFKEKQFFGKFVIVPGHRPR